MTLPDLAVRHRQPELMDDVDLEVGRHVSALHALRRVNRISFAAARVWTEVRRMHAVLRRPVRVLDIACGGGDVLVDVARRARRAGLAVELHGCDMSSVAIAEARRLGASRDVLKFFELDVMRDGLPQGYDLLTTSLFLHHLGHAVLVQDLRRTQLGYVLAWIGLHALTRSDVARWDGLVSVQGAFTLSEVAELCREAGLHDVEIGTGWPQRFTVRWMRA